MNIKRLYNFIIVFFALTITSSAQHSILIDAQLDPQKKILTIEQEITYTNTSNDTLSKIFFHDWAHSFSNKNTPLGKRFSEDFLKKFYFAKDNERGSSVIQKVTDNNSQPLLWSRYNKTPDIIWIETSQPIYPGQNQTFLLKYQIKVPSNKFTRYGYHANGNFSLKYWYIVPAVYDTKWNIYSHKNLDDLYAPLANYKINLTLPEEYEVMSELKKETISSSGEKINKTIQLTGDNRNEINLYIEKNLSFYSFSTNGTELVSNIDDNDLMPKMKSVAIDRIITFLNQRLGPYPFDKLLVSENDYKNNPVYGLNQLPDILRPFPDGFQYEIKQLKTITGNYLEKTLLIDPRNDTWVKDAIHIYLMMAYTEKYYPEMKIIGKLSKVIGIRWFHAADLDFNDQYFLAYKNMARLFLDQPLTMPRNELVKFNRNIANSYKAGVGFKYLEDYLGDDNIVDQSIKDFYTQNVLKHTNSNAYKKVLSSLSSKDIEWFFEDFIATNKKLDFKIKSVKKRNDSLEVTIKNKSDNTMPVSLYGFRKKELVSKTWVTEINDTKKVTIANEDISKLILDYDQNIPEVNRRNNYRNLKWIFNKPIQFRFLEDVEDPRYSQVFFIPEIEFNVYDGFTLASKFYNRSIIRRNFEYNISPAYGFKSNKLLGSASIFNRHQIADYGLYQIRYGVSGSMFSYAPDLLFRRFSTSVSFRFRPKDLRSNENQRLTLRNINVFRERDEENPVVTPDYNVFNARYRYSDFNLINFLGYTIDYQLSKNFSKVSTTINYRKLFLNNRQLNLRLFAGTFLFNDTKKDGDFFSFALDRPTDYLFDYNYLGRSEDTGFVSQQIILAEGGFKSQLDYPFANQWITTFNANTNIWNWIYAYGDVGLVKNKNISPKFVYDAGVRLSLVADYFEVFFPVVSNKGWEISQPNYEEQIRFIITLSPETLIGLFTREWY
ncbi:M1 family metallopeptidase [Aquimarina algiphila]|uniref:M1 family metallopeptidase n=1 Tax=Aquimarina algiphila TaxID=2047982 RepID=A0A554VBV2_9FLAO|nr:M1 family metallopeptidase [Aquimarina algiphila]TSE04074.1 M1 family metallopeptidase [Aquimarina algiphila]